MRVSLQAVMAACTLSTLLGGGGLWIWSRTLPSVAAIPALSLTAQSRVYARDGELIGALSPRLAGGRRLPPEVAELTDVSRVLVDAVVTSEDHRFYQHRGLDLPGLGRAAVRTLRGDLQGGSTITQQLVKNTLLANLHGARTVERKLAEAVLAVEVERAYDKQTILEAYLNVVYWGSTGTTDLVGVASAARAYFGEDARDLTLAQSVYLATLLPSPGRYAGYAGQRPLMRALLNRMVQAGQVTASEAQAAWLDPLEPAGWHVQYAPSGAVVSAALDDPGARARNLPPVESGAHLHFLQAVERELSAKLGPGVLLTPGGLDIGTTMNLQAQLASERASLLAEVPAGATLGLALVEPTTGEVLALVGQKLSDGRPAEWNNATQARRQLGSSIKPLLYTLALERGWTQTDTVLDAPLDGPYQPQNYDGRSSGQPVTLRDALDHSLNLPTVRLAQQVGLDAFRSKLQALGLAVPPQAGLSLAIGTLEASPLQLAAAYATFANGGVWNEPTVLRHVVRARGQDLALPPRASRQVWDPQTAYLGLDLLRGVVNDLGPQSGGLAWRARIPGWDVGGKTGTTNDVKDLWFAGVTPGIAGAVWIGRQAGGALPQNAYSGDLAAPVWQAAVVGTVGDQPPAAFPPPDGVSFAWQGGVPVASLDE